MHGQTIVSNRFGIKSLLLFVLSCGVILAMIANLETRYRISFLSSTLPNDNQRLVSWYQDRGKVRNLSVIEKGNRIQISYSVREVFSYFGFVEPPWRALGYTPLSLSYGRYRSFPSYGWFVAIVIFLGVISHSFFRSKAGEPITENKSPNPPSHHAV